MIWCPSKTCLIHWWKFINFEKNCKKRKISNSYHVNRICWTSRKLCMIVFHKQYGDIIEAFKKDINDSNLEVNKELLLLTFLNNLFGNKLLQRHASSKIFTITGIETWSSILCSAEWLVFRETSFQLKIRFFSQKQ